MQNVVGGDERPVLAQKCCRSNKADVKECTTCCNENNDFFTSDFVTKPSNPRKITGQKPHSSLIDRQFSHEKIKNNQQKLLKKLPGRPYLGPKKSQKFTPSTTLFIKNLTENSGFFCNYAFAANFLGFSKSYIVALTAKRPYIFEKLLPEKLSTQVFSISRSKYVVL